MTEANPATLAGFRVLIPFAVPTETRPISVPCDALHTRQGSGVWWDRMNREFSILRVRRSVLQRWEFPLTFDEVPGTPLAGPFDDALSQRLEHAMDTFPTAQRTADGRIAWRVELSDEGQLDVWLTSDGSLFLEGPTSLYLVGTLFLHLMKAIPAIILEDRITGVLHNRESLLRLMASEEALGLPFRVEQAFVSTPPFPN